MCHLYHIFSEKRKARQEEWDKVRNKDDPEVAPEEPYDSRYFFNSFLIAMDI